MSSDHEVHFDLELLFSLSSLQQTQKRSVVATINSLLNSDAACDELLLEEAADSATAVQASASGDLTSIMAELKPSLQELEELRQVRQELRSTSVEGIQRWTRRSARRRAAGGGGGVEEVQDLTAEALIEEVNSITSSTAVSPSPQTQDQGSQEPSKNLVRCSKCEKKMPRSELKSHIKEAHSRRSKAPDVVSCLFCDEKSSKANMSKHLKEVHGADDGYEKLMDEDIQVPMPKKIKVEEESDESTEQTSQIIAGEVATKTVQVTRESIEAMRKSQTASTPSSVNKDVSKNKTAENTTSKTVHELSVRETANNVAAAASDKTEEKRRCCLCFEMYTQDALKAHKKEVHKHELDLLDLQRNWEPRFSFDECRVSCSEAACDLVFITEMSRDYHVSVRHKDTRHVAPDTRVQKQCRVCKAKFSSSAKLDSHMKRKHATFKHTI